MNIAITIPSTISWKDYEVELNRALNGETLNFKVNVFPINTVVGEKCYLVHKGFIRGYMIISGFSTKKFTCTTTGKVWNGKFIERTGKFFPIKSISMRGFQGFRYVK